MDSDDGNHSIAKKFDLPERKSKIATLMKQNDQVYCICRSSDSTRFMIACDACEEWYHGDCINISEPDAKYIKQYFCAVCIKQNPELKINYKKKYVTPSKSEKSSKSDRKHTGSHQKKDHGALQPSNSSLANSSESRSDGRNGNCGYCQGCLRTEDCGSCRGCRGSARKQSFDSRRSNCVKRECFYKNEEVYDDDQKDVPFSISKSKDKYRSKKDEYTSDEEEEEIWKPKPKKASRKEKKMEREMEKKEREFAKKNRPHKRKNKAENFKSDSSDSEEPRRAQCYGPGCQQDSRPNSKYCSDKCGEQMAMTRIVNIFPERLAEWKVSTCRATTQNIADLKNIQKKIVESTEILEQLEVQRNKLDSHIERMQEETVNSSDDEEMDEEGFIYCVTCGHEVANKTSMKHMEKCFNKYESRLSFASFYQTAMPGTPIFCDFLNEAQKTYCKRLKVLCPEHSKEPKLRDNQMCGYPMTMGLSAHGEFCRTSKKRCNRHHCWEKIRRAQIDMDRVRHYLKKDELLEQERQLRIALASRGAAMGIFLNSTFDHELREKLSLDTKSD